MLVPTTGRTADPSRPQPKRPEVLVTTAATGEGVPALLEALDRHRASAEAAATTSEASRRRAAAQVWTIVGDRVRAELESDQRSAATSHLLDEVAAHRLDPYTAADRLLDERGRR